MPQERGIAQSRKRTVIYVDGFNLYYGVLKDGPYKWLNLERFFCRLRQHDQVERIRYFTARIFGSHAPNQEAYLLALETLPILDIILGQFKSKQVECKVPACPTTGPRIFSTYEEKRTDVNIALWMLRDAQQGVCDRLVLVTGDSDLVPAICMVKECYPRKEVIVYVPARSPMRGAALELRSVAHKDRTLPLDLLPKSQFPAQIRLDSGIVVNKPSTW